VPTQISGAAPQWRRRTQPQLQPALLSLSAIDPSGRITFFADARRDNGKRFVVRSEEKLTAFLELEKVTRESLASQMPNKSARFSPNYEVNRA